MQFEIEAPDEPAMVAAAKLIGAWRAPDPNAPGDPGGFKMAGVDAQGNSWGLNVYGVKHMPTGAMLMDESGESFAEKAPVPGYFAIGAWQPADGVSLPPSPPGVIVRPLPDDSPIRFAE